jgi:hypothetical protein
MKPRKQFLWLVMTALLICVIFLASPATAASMKTAWVSYGPVPDVYLFDIVDWDGCDVKVDAKGRVYTAGIATSQVTGNSLEQCIKVCDANGNMTRNFLEYYAVGRNSLPRDGFLPRLTMDGQENVYFSGNIDSTRCFIYKFGFVEHTYPSPYPPVITTFDSKWSVFLDGAGDQSLGPIAVDGEGNVYAGVNYKLYKFAKDGSPAGSPWPIDTRVSNVTGIALDGQFVYITGGDFATEKYSQDKGQLQWAQTLFPPVFRVENKSIALAMDSQGNVFVTGTQTNNNVLPPATQIYTVKYSPAGAPLWVTESRGSRVRDYHNSAAGLVVDGQGNAYVAGTALNPKRYHVKQEFPDWGDFYTVKYAPDGTILWEKYFNAGTGFRDAATAIARASSGNLVVTGTCKWSPEFPSTEPPTTLMATLCYNPDGQQQWVQYFDGPAGSTEHNARALAVQSGKVYVSGSTKFNDVPDAPYNWPDTSHWLTIKYSSTKKEVRPRP